ncbi:molybdopterin-guanine dinucleotide biosynthesis protein B [Halobacillus salinus]|uniref:Molybdopterin-guanine dinucleotide biosynthesis protein B n=1 Tax=Halobacillus salinus TaxID=192814 RepID=A0A4Z0H491_9BACI|nr:molybdopterin-guanine dinucleotide biosynthesis protein B [Halobacillus salinus]TGB05238.1 molybdopterin-guanine dinucleotide biosynthesis protein B [Halobacillus salinus]
MKQSPVFQMIGYKNSGKTTFLSELVEYGANKGDRVAVIKHHGHKEPLQEMHRETDTYKLKKSGSFLTGVASPNALQIEMNQGMELDRLIEFYRFFSPDLILVEGYKQDRYPKGVLIRRKEDLSLMDLANIQFVITWDVEVTSHIELPVYSVETWTKHLEKIYQTVRGDTVNE